LKAFLATYPDGAHAKSAKDELAKLERERARREAEAKAREEPGSSHLATAPGYDATRLSLVVRATRLIGRNVRPKTSLAGSVGKLEDIALDPATGKLVSALVSSDSGKSGRRVPSGSFTAAGARDEGTVIGMDRETFSSLPRVPKANWTTGLKEEASSPAGFSSWADLIGRPLASQTGDPLGKVEDMMVDLPYGRFVFLVVKPIAELNPTNLYVLPPASVRLNTNGGPLVLKASLEHFVLGDNFDPKFWTELLNTNLAEKVYRHYGSVEGRGGGS
jgi:sporulation protein YlmC with PRC-barrel domain